MESINWSNLEHAYGNASDIPQLLKDLESFPVCDKYDDEPFYTLWSSLCHQGDIYSASYAAVPAIVSIIEKAPNKVSYNYFLLPTCIEIARLKGHGPEINEAFKKNYFNAIQKMASLTIKVESSDEVMPSILSAVTAVHQGNAELADAILELDPETLIEFKEWQENK